MAKSADAFRTISEVADWLETPAHVLRFWESKFSQVKPVKRAGGRRYYRPNDMLLLGGIKQLLHHDGMTIKGVQKLLREQGVKHVAAHSQPLDYLTEAVASDAAAESQPASESASSVVDIQPREEPADAHTVQVTKEESTAADVQAESVDDTPVMPSFSHRPATSDTEETQKSKPDVAPAPTPTVVDIPEDMADEVEAEPGILSQVALLHPPISNDMADRLGEVLDRLRQVSGRKSRSQGN